MVQILLHEPDHPLNEKLLQQMFQLRHRVFKKRLQWKVTSSDGMERDYYDTMSPVYCLCLGDSGQVIGCWRLMQTAKPYLLGDVFPKLLGDHPPPSSPAIWEASRFAYCLEKNSTFSFGGVHEITSHLIAALLETGLVYGLERIVAVSEVRFERILKRSGVITYRFAPPTFLGNTRAVAGWFDVTEENLRRVREAGHLPGNVIPPRRRAKRAA